MSVQTSSGLTFVQEDLRQCRIVMGLLNSGSFNLNSKTILEASQAIQWLNSHYKNMTSNIMEVVSYKEEKPKLEVVENPTE